MVNTPNPDPNGPLAADSHYGGETDQNEPGELRVVERVVAGGGIPVRVRRVEVCVEDVC